MSDEAPTTTRPAVAPTPDTFGLEVSAVFDIQRQLGEQTHMLATMSANYDQQHKDAQDLEKRVDKMTLTMRLGWFLLLTIGGAAAWTILRIWETFLPLLQSKLGIPGK